MKWSGYLLIATAAAAGVVGCSTRTGERPFKLGFMPKLHGIPYFQACRRGAEEAAKELGIELVYNGPDKAEVEPQIDLINQWAASGEYDAIAIACNDPALPARALREARKQGLLVISYDADTQPDARQFFVNQATYDSVARAMVDVMADELEPKGTGHVGILTSSIQAPNQSEWARRMKEYAREKYPAITFLPEAEHGEDRDKGIIRAKALIQANADLKGIIGLTSVAVPAAAEAVRQEKKQGQIKVSGVSTPQDMRAYVLDGTVKTFVLWSPVDLGYLTVHVVDLLRKGKMPENGTIRAGRLGDVTVRDRVVILGEPMRFNRDNIDKVGF
jgi:rhamnose transport system substrate-binding protein